MGKPQNISEYAVQHTSPESELLLQLAAETREKTDAAVMMVGPTVGTFLRLLVRMTRARSVLEIGTFTGYSSLSMAPGLPDDGKLVTLDISEEYTSIARKYWARSPHGKKIELRLGKAIDTLPTLPGPFDLVFIDADKTSQIDYWEHVLPKLSPGGVVVVDNVTFSERVLAPESASAKAVAAFNDHVLADRRVDVVMLTIRDGVTVAVKV